MRTTKPVSTISYNSLNYLRDRLEELLTNHKICDYMFIFHHAEKDEKKDHIHLWIKPNTLLDTMDLQNFFREFDAENPTKPLGCIDFRTTNDTDEWILYSEHFKPYLASKGQSRDYHYTKGDFKFADEDTFDDLFHHAHYASKWAMNNQILEQLSNGTISPGQLVLNGTVPLNMASQLNSFVYMKTHYGLGRNGRPNHELEENSEVVKKSLYDKELDDCVLEYMQKSPDAMRVFQKLDEKLTFIEYIEKYRFKDFNNYCSEHFGFSILGADY